MPTYHDLLDRIRRGATSEEILRELCLRPSHFRRMLRGKRLRAALRLEADLAETLAGHRIASGAGQAADRFAALLEAESDETVRKVCLALLHEGLHGAASASGVGGQTAGPWRLLHPRERDDAGADSAAEGASKSPKTRGLKG